MKKVILAFSILLFTSCSNDCKDDKAEAKEMYEKMLENDHITPEQIQSLREQYAREMAEFDC